MIGSSFGIHTAFQKIIFVCFVLFSTLTLSACGGGVTGDDKNFIIVKDQSVIHLDKIVIESVTADQNLLVVIYAESTLLANTKANTVLGFAAIAAGQHENVVVKLNRDITDNETLFAELRFDKGHVGEFELIDTLVSQSVTTVSFGVIRSMDPYIEIWLDADGELNISSPQSASVNSSKPLAGGESRYPILDSQRIDIKKVITTKESWLVAYRINLDSSVSEIGAQKLSKGHHSDVVIELKDSLSQDDRVFVGIYEIHDGSEGVVFDDMLDEAVIFNGKHVRVDFVIQ